jgi:hypothetical protein
VKKIVLPGLGIGAILTGLVIVPIVAGAIKSGAVDVYLLTPHAPDVVTVNRELWDFDTPDPKTTKDYDRKLMEIYGLPNENKDSLVFIDKSKLVYPAGKNKDGTEKRPDLVFLPVDKQKGENPLQAKSVDFFARLIRIGAVIFGGVSLALWYLLKLRRPRTAATP